MTFYIELLEKSQRVKLDLCMLTVFNFIMFGMFEDIANNQISLFESSINSSSMSHLFMHFIEIIHLRMLLKIGFSCKIDFLD